MQPSEEVFYKQYKKRIQDLEKQLHDAIQCRQCSAKTELSDGLMIGCRAKERIKELEEDKENLRQYASGLENAQNLITVRYRELETKNEQLKKQVGNLRAAAVRKGLMRGGSFTGKP